MKSAIALQILAAFVLIAYAVIVIAEVFNEPSPAAELPYGLRAMATEDLGELQKACSGPVAILASQDGFTVFGCPE